MKGRAMDLVSKTLAVIAFSSAAFTTAAVERIGEWKCAVPVEVYKTMSVAERTCVDRAMSLLNAAERQNGTARMSTCRTAASEWHRFNSEFMTTAKEEPLAWASFFEAYSLAGAADRNKAQEVFAETLELYPDSSASAPALFFRARTWADNGQAAKAVGGWRELCDGEASANHPLALSAHMLLAKHALDSGRLSDAVAEWEAVKRFDRGVSPREWDDAAGSLGLAKAFSDLDGAWADSFADADAIKDPARRLSDLRSWRKRIWDASLYGGCWRKAWFEPQKGSSKDAEAAVREYLRRFTQTFEKNAAPYYRAAGAQWEFALTGYDMWSQLDEKKAAERAAKLAGFIRRNGDVKLRSERARDLFDRLKTARRFTEARTLLDLFPAGSERAYADLGLCEAEGRFEDAVKVLEEVLEKVPDAAEADANRRRHASLCRRMGRYDDAVRLYEAAPDPPSTLWAVADCHRSAGRKAKAQGVLDEICGVFPDEAANAMLRKGDWYRDDGDRKQAVGCYRRILSHADWKKSGAASQAHQRLEGLGVATGGGVVNEVH